MAGQRKVPVSKNLLERAHQAVEVEKQELFEECARAQCHWCGEGNIPYKRKERVGTGPPPAFYKFTFYHGVFQCGASEMYLKFPPRFARMFKFPPRPVER